MQVLTVPRVAAALAILAGLALLLPTRQVELPAAPPSIEAPARAPELRAAGNAAPTPDERPTPGAAKLRELAAMSETFRNTTFLIAIRDAGFVCKELRSVYGGVNNSTRWTASCSEMLAYTVSVAAEGTLHIEPLLEHLDAVPPVVPQQPQRELLPPQRR